MPRRSKSHAGLCLRSSVVRTLTVLVLLVVPSPAFSKDAPLTAIELFDTPNGAAFVQVTDLLINGKAEVRSCGGATTINKSNYGKLAKIPLNSGVTSIERDAAGVMTLTRGSAPECVVPSNLKFDKDESLTLAQIADRATLTGQILSSSPAGTAAIPPFKPGVSIVFVAAPDTELAEFLRATRAHTVLQWQDYLARYPKAAHTDSAKQSLAALLLKEGEEGLASYRNSASSPSPAYPDLKTLSCAPIKSTNSFPPTTALQNCTTTFAPISQPSPTNPAPNSRPTARLSPPIPRDTHTSPVPAS